MATFRPIYNPIYGSPKPVIYFNNTKNNDELENSLKYVFEKFSIKFFNTFKKLSKKHRKLNLANIFPKILSKFLNREKILNLLITKHSKNRFSVSVRKY